MQHHTALFDANTKTRVENGVDIRKVEGRHREVLRGCLNGEKESTRVGK